MKKILFCLIAALFMGVSTGVSADNDDIKVRLDGEYINFDVQPKLVNDRTMVPLRAIFEAIGAQVEWDGDTQTVSSEKENINVILKIGDDKMTVNDKVIELDSPAFIENDRTLVPLRAISESYNINVEWREKKNLVSMASVNLGVTQNTVDATVKAINHMGYHVSAPQNSLEAFRQSRKMGYSYVETDILFTKDNVPVLTHDVFVSNIAKNTDGSDIENGGNLANQTYEQLLEYDYGISYGQEWAGTKLANFEDFIQLCDNLNLYPFLDMKDKFSSERIDVMINILKKHDMLDRVTWCKYYAPVLEKLPDAQFCYTAGPLDYSYIDDIAKLSEEGKRVITFSGINDHMFADYLLDDFTKYAPVYAWTVNDEKVVRKMCESGKVGGVCTDVINVADILNDIDITKSAFEN